MPEQVQGYLDARGHFFQTELEASLSDAIFNLKLVLKEEEMSDDFILNFLHKHREVILEYFNCLRKYYELKNELKNESKSEIKPLQYPLDNGR